MTPTALQNLLCRIKHKTGNERLLDVANFYNGVAEVPGKKSNALILGWIKEAASWLGDDVGNDDSQVAWCGCFRGSVGILTGTGVPAAHYRARNWLNWGKAIDHKKPALWLPGDTIITTRSGGFHVTLYAGGIGKTHVNCLGGNQSNKVCIAPIALNIIIGVRRAP